MLRLRGTVEQKCEQCWVQHLAGACRCWASPRNSLSSNSDWSDGEGRQPIGEQERRQLGAVRHWVWGGVGGDGGGPSIPTYPGQPQHLSHTSSASNSISSIPPLSWSNQHDQIFAAIGTRGRWRRNRNCQPSLGWPPRQARQVKSSQGRWQEGFWSGLYTSTPWQSDRSTCLEPWLDSPFCKIRLQTKNTTMMVLTSLHQ